VVACADSDLVMQNAHSFYQWPSLYSTHVWGCVYDSRSHLTVPYFCRVLAERVGVSGVSAVYAVLVISSFQFLYGAEHGDGIRGVAHCNEDFVFELLL
jgi:hypothetical protein